MGFSSLRRQSLLFTVFAMQGSPSDQRSLRSLCRLTRHLFSFINPHRCKVGKSRGLEVKLRVDKLLLGHIIRSIGSSLTSGLPLAQLCFAGRSRVANLLGVLESYNLPVTSSDSKRLSCLSRVYFRFCRHINDRNAHCSLHLNLSGKTRTSQLLSSRISEQRTLTIKPGQ